MKTFWTIVTIFVFSCIATGVVLAEELDLSVSALAAAGQSATSPEGPQFDSFDPAPGETGVSTHSPITLKVHSDIGVDPNSVTVTVDGRDVSAQLSYIADGFNISYRPSREWDPGQTVNVSLSASTVSLPEAPFDPPLTTETAYSFQVEDSPGQPLILLGGYGQTWLSEAEGGELTLTAFTSNPQLPGDVQSVQVTYAGIPTELELFDDGAHADFAAGDGVFGLSLALEAGIPAGQYLFGLVATDSLGMESPVWPYLTVGGYASSAPALPRFEQLIADEIALPLPSLDRPYIQYAGFYTTMIDHEDGGSLCALAVPADPQGLALIEVQLLYGEMPTGIMLLDDGAHGDFAANDGIFGVILDVPPGMPTGQHLLRMIAINEAGVESDPWPYLSVQ